MQVREFVHRAGGHCGSSALRDLLEHHELSYTPEPLSEAMVFGLAGGLAFAFADEVTKFGNEDITLPFYMNGRSADLEERLCVHLGAAVELRQTDDSAEGWGWLRDELNAGRPTMVRANMKDLDYQRVRLDNTLHVVVVIDYDADRELALVADHDFADLQECPLSSLRRARAAHAFPGAARHATWLVEFPERLPAAREAVAWGLRRAVDTMRSGGESSWEVSDGRGGSSSKRYVQGLQGVEAFATSYASWPERFGEGLQNALRLLYVLVELAGTGGGFYRKFHAQFLEEAAALLEDELLGVAAVNYRELADVWQEVAWASRAGDSASAHREGLRRVERARELEIRGTELMESWLERSRSSEAAA